jgi:hypothetical protein
MNDKQAYANKSNVTFKIGNGRGAATVEGYDAQTDTYTLLTASGKQVRRTSGSVSPV